MTRTQQCTHGPKERWTSFALTGLSGLLAGAARAIVDWLLRYLCN